LPIPVSATPLLAAATGHERAAPWLCLELADTGPALDERQRELIFEPFLSCDGPTVTTRLGLATADSRVAQNHGLLECVSQPGSDTRLRVWLPTYAARVDTP